MKFLLKILKNIQAFNASLFIVLIVFLLDYFLFNLLISSDSELILESKAKIIIFYLILFIIIRLTLEIYTSISVRNRVSRILTDINPDLIKELTSGKDLENITNQLQLRAEERKSELEILKDQESYRREFLGNVSHELKTPLFTIQGYILTLIEGAMKDKKVRDKYLKRSAKGVDRLITIVKDLDLITQFESGIKTVNKSIFNINELLENVFELMEFEAEKNNISIKIQTFNKSINVFADQERISQVLTNLIVNSIKYGKENGYTKVLLEDYNKEKVLVRIIDNGEGIEDEHLPRLFERFYRIDKNRSRKKGGSGLGLSIVKHIIEAHNEQIFVDSKIGVGSQFSFTLTKS